MVERTKREVLAESPLFTDLLPTELELLVALTVEREYRQGDVVFAQGSPGDAVFVIASGAVSISASSPNGEVKLAEFTTPQFFGEMSLIDKAARSATARALTDTRLLQLTNENLHIFAKNHRNGFTWVIVNIARMLSTRLRETNRRLMERG